MLSCGVSLHAPVKEPPGEVLRRFALPGTELGTEADGSASPDYCSYCYKQGKFAGEMSMEEMIDFCAPMMAQSNPGMTQDQAKDQMRQFFPMLKRWKK